MRTFQITLILDSPVTLVPAGGDSGQIWSKRFVTFFCLITSTKRKETHTLNKTRSEILIDAVGSKSKVIY
jgi:hypothetical protein